MVEYLALSLIGEMVVLLATENINVVDTYIIQQSLLPDHNLTIENVTKISPIDDHLTYGKVF